MAASKFDESRMAPELYDFNKPTSAAAFMRLVDDYMSYLRTNPKELNASSWSDTTEKRMAGVFISMIDHDKRWPLARLMAPEFRILRSTYVAPQFYPLRAVLDSIIHRLPEPIVTRVDAQPQYVEELFWKKMAKCIELVAYSSNGQICPTAEKITEVEQAKERLREIAEASRTNT